MSATLVTVSATFDKDLIYYPNGKIVTIQSDSEILGTKTLPIERVIPGTTGGELTADLLHIKSIDQGDLYLNMSLADYNALIKTASLTPPIALTETYTIGTDKPAGTTITDPIFANSTILRIGVDGTDVDLRTITYATVGLNGVLTFPTPLNAPQVVAIEYYNN